MGSIDAWLGPLLGAIAVVAGALVTSWAQSRESRRQSQQAHQQSLELLLAQFEREDSMRNREFLESDCADRSLVGEYVEMLIPRLIDVAGIDYIASDNRDVEELQHFQNLQRFMQSTDIDAAHPERNLGLRMAFLMFQIMAAMRLALNARWTRPLSDEQSKFLQHWDRDIEPMMCSGKLPGKPLLYREQIEVIVQLMLIKPDTTELVRPVNWSEFCSLHGANPVVKDLSEQIADRIRFIFDESNSLPPRKAMQCRLAVMALYLVRIADETAGGDWEQAANRMWKVAAEWFAWERDHGQNPWWYVYAPGDVEERAAALEQHPVRLGATGSTA